MVKIFITGLLFAFGLILPLGQQNVFVLSQGMQCRSLLTILTVVVTASLCDTFLILSSAFGLSFVILSVPFIKEGMLILGALCIWWFAYQAWKQDDKLLDNVNKNERHGYSIKKIFFLTLGISILNPYAFIDTMVTIGSASLTYTKDERTVFLGACILVSWLWFASLAFFGKRLAGVQFFNRYKNRIAASMMGLSGIYLLYLSF